MTSLSTSSQLRGSQCVAALRDLRKVVAREAGAITPTVRDVAPQQNRSRSSRNRVLSSSGTRPEWTCPDWLPTARSLGH